MYHPERIYPASSMHQSVEFEELVGDYLEWSMEEKPNVSIPRWAFDLAAIVALPAFEYADDGSHPLDYCEIGNSELEFIDHFGDEMAHGIEW